MCTTLWCHICANYKMIITKYIFFLTKKLFILHNSKFCFKILKYSMHLPAFSRCFLSKWSKSPNGFVASVAKVLSQYTTYRLSWTDFQQYHRLIFNKILLTIFSILALKIINGRLKDFCRIIIIKCQLFLPNPQSPNHT